MITGFGNNVVSALAAEITASQKTIPVMPGTGVKFAALLTQDNVNPSTELDMFAKITLTDSGATEFEICHLLSVSGDVLSVARGQEGTPAKGWMLNDVVANFATRGSENQFVQIDHLQSGFYCAGIAGGSANALTLSLPSAFFINGATDWMLRTPVIVYPTQGNTGASTLQLVMGGRVLGTFPLYKGDKAQLVAGDIIKDVALVCMLDKSQTFFSVMNPGAIYAGLGTAAFKDIVTSMTDTTAGRATVVGWMGTGGPEIPIPDGTDIYKYFATAASGNYGGGSGLINAATTSGWVGFKWQQHGAGNKYGFLLEQASSGQMALHIYNNQNGDMTSPEKYWSNSGLLFSVKNPPTAVQTGALPNPGTLLTSIYDIAGSGIYAALGKGNEKPTEGMPDDSGNTRYTVLATEVYAGQYWVTLISKNEFYVGQVVISGKTASWCRYYNTGFKQTAADTGALPLAGGTMAPAGQISVSQVGKGMWTSQNTVGAPVFQNIDTAATSEYWPIFKQHYQQGNSTWSAGMLINEGDFHLHFLNSAGDTANFRWVKDGQFIPGSYANFDERYLRTTYAAVQGWRWGAKGNANNGNGGGNVGAAAPNGAAVVTVYQKSDWSAVDYRYAQYLYNGTWYNAGVAS